MFDGRHKQGGTGHVQYATVQCVGRREPKQAQPPPDPKMLDMALRRTVGYRVKINHVTGHCVGIVAKASLVRGVLLPTAAIPRSILAGETSGAQACAHEGPGPGPMTGPARRP